LKGVYPELLVVCELFKVVLCVNKLVFQVKICFWFHMNLCLLKRLGSLFNTTVDLWAVHTVACSLHILVVAEPCLLLLEEFVFPLVSLSINVNIRRYRYHAYECAVFIVIVTLPVAKFAPVRPLYVDFSLANQIPSPVRTYQYCSWKHVPQLQE
jgi:hypothetical protein